MNETNQIIKALHKKADDDLEASIEALLKMVKAAMAANLADTWSSFRASEETNSAAFPRPVNSEQMIRAFRWWMRNACRDRKREQVVADFMARVGRLTDELDEIRAIAEQQPQ